MNAVKEEESNMIDIDVKVEYLMDIKREEVEEVVEEVVVGVKRKAEEETKPGKTKKKRVGKGKPWTEEEDDALLKVVGKYGLDFKRIKDDNDKVLAHRTLADLQTRLYLKFPEKYEELRAVTPSSVYAWTSEEDAALKRGVEVHGSDWEKIMSNNEFLKRRKTTVIKKRYNRLLRK
ncbi:hypothetical protein TrVE_jg12699 [Triparma verrucosa]|uniref:Myb-like domain-containing protein n=1 Tax=Triparma verrucosa TaxID=1606542 RepID=A0A9W7KT11_9STRA|nr:hypothetical protein TrVE_jg12699 [Triparma verrucosa]